LLLPIASMRGAKVMVSIFFALGFSVCEAWRGSRCKGIDV
jgi:hypothetical protein